MSNLKLFPDIPLDLDLQAEVKRMAAADLKACRFSRTEVAEKLSEMMHRPVSEDMINAVTSETKTNRMPAEWLSAWTEITGSTRILALLCRRAGLWLGNDDDRRFADLGRAYIAERKAAGTITALERELEGKL